MYFQLWMFALLISFKWVLDVTFITWTPSLSNYDLIRVKVYGWFSTETQGDPLMESSDSILYFRKVYASWPLIYHSATFEMDAKMSITHAGDIWTVMIRILNAQKWGSLSELYRHAAVFPWKETAKYISFHISCLNNVDISTFQAMQF